jgi:WD40 repeat protein
VEWAAFSPDGARLAVAAPGNDLLLLASDGGGVPLHVPHPQHVRRARFSPDGARLVTVSGEVARLFAAGSGEHLHDLVGHTNAVFDAAFDATGRMVVTSAWDDTVRFWSPGDGRELTEQRRRAGVSAALSPDGRRLATSDRVVAIVSTLGDDRNPLALGPHPTPVNLVAFAPDGTRVATVADTVVRVWRIEWRALYEALSAATTACLAAEERTRYLEESPAVAAARHADCERRYGRQP